MKDFGAVIQCTKLLMTVMEHKQSAALTSTSTTPSEIGQLKTQITIDRAGSCTYHRTEE